MFEEIDNMVWSRSRENLQNCDRTIRSIVRSPRMKSKKSGRKTDEDEPIRLNGKYVWETAKRVCDFINAHEDINHITSLGEYRCVMLKVIKAIKEADNVERKRRRTKRKDKCDEAKKTMQRAKALIADIKRGSMERQEVERMLESIIGKGSHEEIANATMNEKIVEMAIELSRREEHFEVCEKMRRKAKRRRWEDRRMNNWRKNKPSRRNLEVDVTLQTWKRRLSSGEGSTIKKSVRDGETPSLS